MRQIASRRIQALSAAFVLSGLLAGAAQAQQQPGGEAPPTPVTVVTLEKRDVTLTSTLPGRVVASGVAEVRPQVSGIIVERLFTEGGEVSVGDPLYRIDPATYEATVASAKAQVAQAEAQLRSAERDLTRAKELTERKVTSTQSLDEAIATRDSAAAAVAVAKAQQLSAEIDLDRTTIRAPLSGVIGRSLTTQGALVTDGQSDALAVIRTLDPVLVDVTQSAAEIIAWKRGVTSEKLQGAAPDVSLTLADGGGYDHTGSLKAAEPNVNEQTGVVTLRMTFPNPEKLLLPGMYVQVEMPQGVAKNVVLAPQQGVARDRRGRPTALIVNAEGVVEQRVLTVVQAMGSDWVVSEGFEDGDKLIVEGVQKVRPGAKAAPEEQTAAAGDTELADAAK